MKKLKTFEQHNTEMINEGIKDFFTKIKDKVKSAIQKKVNELGGDKLAQLKKDIEPYQGKSVKELRQMLTPKIKQAAMSTNEGASEDFASQSKGTKIASIIFGGAYGLSGIMSIVFLIMSNYDSSFIDNNSGLVLTTMLIFIVPLILGMIIGACGGDTSHYRSASDGVSDAERHSSAYIANQSRQADRNAGY